MWSTSRHEEKVSREQHIVVIQVNKGKTNFTLQLSIY